MPKLILVPIESVKNVFKKDYYLPLMIYPSGYHVILNDKNIAEVVECYLLKPIESENGLEMEEEHSTCIFYPKIWSKSNRMLEPGKYWNVGMNSLHERIKTAKGIRMLGFKLSQEDKLLVDSKIYRINLFRTTIEQANMFLAALSDGYNSASISCILREDVRPEQLVDVVNYLFYDHGPLNGVRFQPEIDNNPLNVKEKIKKYLDLCFSHATTYSRSRNLSLKNIKSQIFYDFLEVIEDWEYKAYFLRYDIGGGEDHLRIIILDEQKCLLILCLDNWFH
ncbi:MAG: hypothetical protein AAGA77_23600 [Bacteroidota bacterium]